MTQIDSLPAEQPFSYFFGRLVVIPICTSCATLLPNIVCLELFDSLQPHRFQNRIAFWFEVREFYLFPLQDFESEIRARIKPIANYLLSRAHDLGQAIQLLLELPEKLPVPSYLAKTF